MACQDKKWHASPQELQLISAQDIFNKFIYMNGGSEKKQVQTERDVIPTGCSRPQIFQWQAA